MSVKRFDHSEVGAMYFGESEDDSYVEYSTCAALKEENERYAIALTEICNWHVIPSSVGGHAALALIQRAKEALGYDYDYKRFLAYIKEKTMRSMPSMLGWLSWKQKTTD